MVLHSFPHSPYPFYLLILALALTLVPEPAHPEPVRIDIAQEATLPGWYDGTVSVDSSLLYGRIAFRGGDRLPEPADYPDTPVNPWKDPDLRYWTLQARPMRPITITAGSLAVSGLPARARSPFFTIYQPRYTALTPSRKPVILPGTSLNTDNLAVECATTRWTLAAAGDPENRLDDPAWCLGSIRFGSPKNGAGNLSLSALYGAKKLDQDTDDSWFLDRVHFKPTTVSIPGAEAVYAGKVLTASATVFASFGSLLPTGWLVRSDCSVTGRLWTLSAGYSRSTRDYIPLDGVQERLLERAFLAPSLAIGHDVRTELGGILMRDRERPERYYEHDRETLTAGGFCALSAAYSEIEARCMADSEGTTLSASLSAKKKGFPLSLGVTAKTTLTDESESILDGNDCRSSAGIGFQKGLSRHKRAPVRRKADLEASIAGSIERATPSDDPVHEGSLTLSCALSGRHAQTTFAVGASVSDGNTPWKGALSLEIAFK